jgi:hypothetical protein
MEPTHRRQMGIGSVSALSKPDEFLSAARDETHALLATAEHYLRCARLHLEVDDDAVAFYDISSAREHFLLAITAFKPIRRAISERSREAA